MKKLVFQKNMFFIFFILSTITLIENIRAVSTIYTLLNLIRWGLLVIAFLVIIENKIKFELLFSLLTIPLFLLTKNKFALEILTIFFLFNYIKNVNFNSFFIYLLFFITTILALNELNIIEGKSFSLGSVEENFYTSAKNSLGVWNPNVLSLLIFSTLIWSHLEYGIKSPLFLFSLFLYLFTFPDLFGRTYLICLIVYFILSFIINKKNIFRPLLWVIYLLTLILACIEILSPILLKNYPDLAYLLNLVTSNRINVYSEALLDMSFFNIIFGLKSNIVIVDSFYINLFQSIGLLGTTLFFIFIGKIIFTQKANKQFLIVLIIFLVAGLVFCFI